MVDFNNDNTISKPPKEIVSLIVIEKFYNFLEADEHVMKQRIMGANASFAVPRARLRNLFLVCYPMLKRRMKDKEFESLRELCVIGVQENKKVEYKDIVEGFTKISALLDQLELTKLDTKPGINRTKIEQSNRAQGY